MGPYTLEEVNRYLDEGKLQPTDLVWNERLETWAPLSMFPGVKASDAPDDTSMLDAPETPQTEEHSKYSKMVLVAGGFVASIVLASYFLLDSGVKAGPAPTAVPNTLAAKTAIEDAIREALEKPEGILTEADLEKVTRLSLSQKGISDLAPLKSLIELKWLELDGNLVANLSPLAGLKKLEVLWLQDNMIGNLSVLGKLKKLEVLDLRNNEVTDLTPLMGLTYLRSLYLHDNGISDGRIADLQEALPDCNIAHK